MKVIAAKGLSVPMEDKPKEFIGDSEAVEVPDTPYFFRRIADGDLVEEVEKQAAEEGKGAETPAPKSTRSTKTAGDK